MKFTAIVCSIVLFVSTAQGAPLFTHSFGINTLGPGGSILGLEHMWPNPGSLRDNFDTNTSDGFYVQGRNIELSSSSINTAAPIFDQNNATFRTISASGVLHFDWTTFQTGFIRHTTVETGRGSAEFTLNTFTYMLNIETDRYGFFEGRLYDFQCQFNINGNPTIDTEANEEVTTRLFPQLREGLQNVLNNLLCPELQRQMQAQLNRVLQSAQTTQRLSWSSGPFFQRKDMALTPTTTIPFRNNALQIISGQGLKMEGNNSTCNNTSPFDTNEVIQESDSEMLTQGNDICMILNQDLVLALIEANVEFYQKKDLIASRESATQRFYPFNLWQFWETALYDIDNLDRIGTEQGQFRQTDPITIECTIRGVDNTVINNDGTINTQILYRCTLNVFDSNNGRVKTTLNDFTFHQQIIASISLNGRVINGQIDDIRIANLNGILDNALDVRNNIVHRFPLNVNTQLQARLFGMNGISFNFIEGKEAIASRQGNNLQICFR
ncbi:unnamed protein product [Moneuplotes crassus]|uniref:Uncharacterized protein n=1 Tax=Euplotes crassus TaxID=5936 RepID=A0AAD1XCQ1_EUPCR|nr:unnamed protein product [Moneuplotes crassus]